ncbi:MAG: YggS family pyridoxal phosphate-dependent enzyme [Cytophagaceae bacterium]
MDIKTNLNNFNKKTENTHCKLVAVSKTYPPEEILKAWNLGQRMFGENKVQEMTEKWEVLPKDIQWHMIGHLQRNKVKYIAPYVHLIHSVDSLRLLKEINKEAFRNERIIDCLLQIHIAAEETKFGLSEEEAFSILNSDEFQTMGNVRITGLMGMATNTTNQEKIRGEFQFLRALFEKIKSAFSGNSRINITELSMGMSSDYEIAIEEGSTMIRIGSAIFGKRDYA